MIEGCWLLVLPPLAAAVAWLVARAGRQRLLAELTALEARVRALEATSGVARAATPGAARSEAPAAAPPGPLPAAASPVAQTIPSSEAVEPAGPPTVEIPRGEAGAAAPPPPRSLEERLGARLPVWIGAVALALAGAFLVKYSLDQGWIGPAVRVVLAVLFGLALLAAGEGMRRSPGTIAQGLSAAGVAVLFSAFLAAVHLYRLIPPELGFLLMAATTALAVVLSLRHGPMVALIGLLGGMLTPYLVRLAEPRAWGLFGYLLLVEAGLLAVSRRRGWPGVALTTLAAGFAWVVLWLAGFGVGEPLWPALFLLATAGAGVVSTGAAGLGSSGGWSGPESRLLLRVSMAGSLVLLSIVTGSGGYATTEWLFLGLLAAGILVLGRLDERLETLPPVAAVAVLVLLLSWVPQLARAELPRFLGVATALAILFAVGGYLALWGSRRPLLWSGLAAATGVAAPLVASVGAAAVAVEHPWEAWCAGLAVASAAAAVPLVRRREDNGPAVEPLALAAAVLLGMAAAYGLSGRWLTLALAFEVPLLAWSLRRWQLTWLRLPLSVLTALVPLRWVFSTDVLRGRVAAWVLAGGFALTIAALLLAARWLRPRQDSAGISRLRAALTAVSLVLAAALVPLEVHRLLAPGEWLEPPAGLWGWTLLVTGWAILGWLAWAGGRGWPEPEVWERGGRGVLLLSVVAALVGPGLTANPALAHVAVGEWPVVNLVLVAYGVPSLLFALLGRSLRAHGDARLSGWVAAAALVFLFLLVTLEVRQAFRGGFLDAGGASPAERYAYSAAWILLSTGLLVVGIARRWPALRYAALAVMTLSVAKVFLYDTAHLSDLFRVLSYLGLGLSLMLLAWLYQRFVFQGAER